MPLAILTIYIFYLNTKKMKKITLLSCSIIFITMHANGQMKTNAGTFTKPSKGSILSEITFAPNLGGTAMFSLPSVTRNAEIVGVKGRYFYDNNNAYRFAGNISIKSSGVEGENASVTIGLTAGLEKHLIGAERVSTYWGYDANIGFKSNQVEQITGSGSTIFITKNTLGLGSNVFTGFDYYIMPNVYLGVEVAYGLAITNTKYDYNDGFTAIELAPGISSFLRLGWKL
jgi:hypothetical protein